MTQASENQNPSAALSVALASDALYAAAANAAYAGDYVRALDILETLRKSVEPTPSILTLLGKIHAQQGRYAKAIEAWNQALERLGDSASERAELQEAIGLAEELTARPQSLTEWRKHRATLAGMSVLLTIFALIAALALIGGIQQSRELARLQISLTQTSRQQEQRLDTHQSQLKEWRDSMATGMKKTWSAYDATARQRENRLMQALEAERKETRQTLDSQAKALKALRELLTKPAPKNASPRH